MKERYKKSYFEWVTSQLVQSRQVESVKLFCEEFFVRNIKVFNCLECKSVPKKGVNKGVAF